MKRICVLVLMIFTLCLKPIYAYAEANDNNLADENNSEIEVTEIIDFTADYSNTPVEVTEYSNGQETVIYTGLLGGYENGDFKFLDFMQNDFAVIFDWESIENKVFYITPQNFDEEKMDKSKQRANVDKESDLIEPKAQVKQQQKRLDRNLLEENTQPITDDIEYEMNYTIGTINDKSVISVNCNITNNSLITKNPVMIIAIYEDGKLLNLKTQSVEVMSSSTESGNIFLELPEENKNRYAIKLMAWESINSIRPLGTAKTVNDIDAYLREKYIYFDTTEGEEIKVFMNSTQTIGNNPNAVHTIIYNPEEFEPKDLCGLTYEKELVECEPENTNICIFDFEAENGIIKYKFNSEIGRNTGINNYIKFTALSTNDDCEIQYIIQ